MKRAIHEAEQLNMLTCNMIIFWLQIAVNVEENESLIVFIEKYLLKFPLDMSLHLKYLGLKAESAGKFILYKCFLC